MSRADIIEEKLSGDWKSVREISHELGFPVPTVSSALATLYKYDGSIERIRNLCPFHNRPVWHYRRVE